MATPSQRAARKRRRAKKKARAAALRPSKLAASSRMAGPGPSTLKVSTGRLGLAMSSGSKPGAMNRREKVCEEDEFIANVIASTTTTSFNISNTINVNPGLVASFPWLSAEAARYNEYEFEYLEYYFKRTASEYLATAGKVLLYFDPDAADSPPSTKQQIEDSVYHNDGMPCDPLIRLPVDCDRIRKNDSKYVRAAAAPAGTDIRLYDAGLLYCACDSNNSGINGAAIGELRVRYRVRFTVPVLNPSSLTGGSVHFSGTAPTTANNFATAALQAGGTPTLTGITAAANAITFPAGIPGNYLVTMAVAGSTSATAIGLTPSAGATALNLVTYGGTRDSIASPDSANGGANVPAMAFGTFTVANTGGTLTVTPATLVGGNAMDLFITSLPSTVLTSKDPIEQRMRALERAIAQLAASPVSSSSSSESSPNTPFELASDDMQRSVHLRPDLASRLVSAIGALQLPSK